MGLRPAAVEEDTLTHAKGFLGTGFRPRADQRLSSRARSRRRCGPPGGWIPHRVEHCTACDACFL
ncbi:hypothetical protein GCM10010254_34430 [Streptomyces chromofuscus]|nr:hypothetical protein GCM10010254_34430 [Streptomyces chromofuscus]